MANVKFLMGDLANLPNIKTEGQVYFTYKNVGSADNPNYVGALYLDKNNSVRIKMTANADIAEKDSAGNTITSTYIKNASISSNGTSNTLTFTKGDNKTFTVTIPAATDSLAGLITNGEQTFSGTKTFNNTINLVNDKTGINWSRVTDGASILFYAETDSTDNYLDFHVTDDENVNFRWTKTVGSENLTLGTWKREGIRLGSGKFIGDLTGNADSSTKLKTARSINGTNFDGTGNITTTNWGTSRTITIGNTGKSVNGDSNVSWSLSEIGASAIGHTHTSIIDSGNNVNSITFSYGKPSLDYSDYTWLAAWNGTELRTVKKSQFATAGHTHLYAGSSSAGGAATSAIKLFTPRKIGKAFFDGTSDITLTQMGVYNPIEITKAEYENLRKNNKIDMSAYYNIIDDYDSIDIINDEYISSNQVFSSLKVDSVYSKKSILYNITLESQKWVKKNNKYQYILSVNEITEENIIEVNYSSNATADEINVYQKAGLTDGGQSKGQGILLADILPAIDIPITVIIRNDL